MTGSPLDLLARLVGISGLAAARPMTCLLVVQGGLLLLNHSSPPALEHWLLSTWALVVVLAATVVEWVAEHDSDIEEVLRALWLDRLLRAAATLATAELVLAAGLQDLAPWALAEPGVVAAIGPALEGGEAGPWLRIAALGGTAGLNLLLTTLRGWLLDHVQAIGLKETWQRLETGGVLVALVLFFLFPVLVLAGVVLATAAMAATVAVLRVREKAVDTRRRLPCPACGTPVRVEAALCKHCRCSLIPLELDRPRP